MNANQSERIEIAGLAPGQYELTQGDPPRVVVLDANTSQQVEPGAGIPAFALSGTLQTATGAPFTGEAVVTLEPADNAQGLKPMVSEFNHGSFSFAAVPAGKWKLDGPAVRFADACDFNRCRRPAPTPETCLPCRTARRR